MKARLFSLVALNANGKELLERAGAETALAQVSVAPRASQAARGSLGMPLVISVVCAVEGVWSKEIKGGGHSEAKVMDHGTCWIRKR